MLSYRHLYHAGNYADVVKHSVLALVLQALQRKEAPLCYLDTHAGIGRYDLQSEAAQKTGEYRRGIALLADRSALSPELEGYLAAVRALNRAPAAGASSLRFYPGSPRIARFFLRPQDRMVLMELHGSDLPALRREFAGDPQVAVHHRDGYEGLKAFLPPRERRGLVLIDPSYELKGEFDQVVNGLRVGYKRWATGVYAVWYPILDRASVERFHRALRDSGIRKILRAELSIRPDDAPLGLNGCGMLIINPPWQLDERLQRLLPWLWDVLALERQGAVRLEWLVPE